MLIRFCDDCCREREDTRWEYRHRLRLCEGCFTAREQAWQCSEVIDTPEAARDGN